ncbi:sugar ABC transporter ATP-binding protein [Pseudooceanicola sp.]|uniref:sugar ABC transporter ATP-binding protein n=1 Tax=Pseudooceanicola sp. TaxID=1914328 RepID=UPI0035131541
MDTPTASLEAAQKGAPSQPAPPVLSVQGLARRFGAIQALSDVSLDLRSGEIRAILGENGAGKSTLVKILTGIHMADAGEIQIDGAPVRPANPREAQDLGINLVSQELSVCRGLSVFDNILLGLSDLPMFHRRPELRRRAREALDSIGAGHIPLDKSAEDLSTGERQLIEIARMMSRDTRVLILDEPTATLSDGEIASIMSALRKLRANGCAILYITHRLGEVFDVCDTATIMRNGAVVSDGPVADLDKSQLIELMLGRSLGDMYPAHEPKGGKPLLQVTGLQIPNRTEAVSFSVPRGQIVCLTGQLGSGAEDVVRSLCGLVSDASGTISVDDQVLPLGRPEKALAAGIRFVSGDRAEEGIFIQEPVWSNLVATRLRRRSQAGWLNLYRLRKEARGLAAHVGVDLSRMATRACDLSGGNQQKLAFGRWVDDHGGKVIAMIEPTRGIDVGARAEIYALMRRFCEQGYGLVIASTDFTEVLGLGDVVVTMFRGRVINSYNADAIDMPRLIADVTHPEAA